MCNLADSLYNYLEDVYSVCFPAHLEDDYSRIFPAHLSERCVVWVFHCIYILKICILATLPHICLKDMHPDNVQIHLCETYVYLDIYVKKVHAGHSVY